MASQTLARFRPPPDLGPGEWAEKYRRMGSRETAFVGRFTFDMVPFFRWLLLRYRDRDVRKIVVRKSAQVGYTQSVICNLMGYFAHVEKSTCVAMFPKEGSARQFDREKFDPMVASTPALRSLLPVKARVKDQTALYKSFPGGFIKLVGSNSISDVKSTSARRLIVEEPDDCNLNLRGQGDSIKLIEERGKGYRDVKILIGGTPSIKGVSSIDDEYERSDKCEWHVPCPDCGTFQPLEWEQVTCTEDPEQKHAILGQVMPETARYRCAAPECGSLWTNDQKNAAIARGKAVAGAPFRGTVGLQLNELYSAMHNSRMPALVERHLEAKHEYDAGKPEALITFHNATLGRAWEFKGEAPEANALLERALPYEAQHVPAGGLMLTAGIDFQHDRFAIVIRAWGRGDESWLVLWDEIDGNVHDKGDAIWTRLDEFLFGEYVHESGVRLKISAASLDSSDGNTGDQVYAYVRTRQRRGCAVMAIKGSSTPGKEIFTRPAAVDVSKKPNTKAKKRGLQVYNVGTDRAKDLIIESRLRLEGDGPGRFHFYRDVRADYFEQLLGEVKVPRRDRRNVKVWQRKAGVRNEALDCEVYALHAARSLKLHLYREETWEMVERRVLLVKPAAKAPPQPEKEPPSAPPSSQPPSDAPSEPASPEPSQGVSKAAETAVSPPQAPAAKAKRVRAPRKNWVTGW